MHEINEQEHEIFWHRCTLHSLADPEVAAPHLK